MANRATKLLNGVWKWCTWPFRDDSKEVDRLVANPAFQELITLEFVKERRQDRKWVMVKRFGYAFVFLLMAYYYVQYQDIFLGHEPSIPSDDLIGVVHIDGAIEKDGASADKIVPALRRAFEANNVKVVLISIDSPGGAPLEAERINVMIDELKAKHEKPVIAVIQNVGASAAYMVAVHADEIYAGRYSIVGSIGAVLSRWDFHQLLEHVKIKQVVYQSGELKAMLNPYVASSEAAELKAQLIVSKMGKRFNEEVKERRKCLKDNVRYDTGEFWDGADAKEICLIDDIGTIESIAAKYKDAKIHDFGPRHGGGGWFSAKVQELTKSVIKGAAEGLREGAPLQ